MSEVTTTAFPGSHSFKLASVLKNPSDKRKVLKKAGEWLPGFINLDGTVTVRVGRKTQEVPDTHLRGGTFVTPVTMILPREAFSDARQGYYDENLCDHEIDGDCMRCRYEFYMST